MILRSPPIFISVFLVVFDSETDRLEPTQWFSYLRKTIIFPSLQINFSSKANPIVPFSTILYTEFVADHNNDIHHEYCFLLFYCDGEMMINTYNNNTDTSF